MSEALSVTKADVRLVMQEWLDQPGEECSNLNDLENCVEYFFASLKKVAKADNSTRHDHVI